MTGASITASFDMMGVLSSLQRAQGVAENPRPLLKRIGIALVKTTQERFETAKDPEGKGWTPLNPEYAAFKRGPGILREKAMRGGLMGSMTFRLQGANAVAIGSNKKYAAVHQFGAVIRPVNAKALVFRIGKRTIHAAKVTIPPRPYLGFGPADRLAAAAAVEFTIREALTGG